VSGWKSWLKELIPEGNLNYPEEIKNTVYYLSPG
jgi:hypothetical protein